MPAKTPEVRNIFSTVPNPISPKGVKPAKQEFKDDADINSIMRKFQKTGTIDHASKYQPEYGIASPTTFQESMNIVTRAQSIFNALPSSVRNKFNNSAAEFLEFVQDEKNYEEGQKIGLELSPEAHSKAQERIAAQAAAKELENQKIAAGEQQAAPPA